MYRTLEGFTDGEKGLAYPPQRGGVYYAAGDDYPVDGFKPTKAHINYLLGDKNTLGRPVIEVKEPEKEAGGGAGTIETPAGGE